MLDSPKPAFSADDAPGLGNLALDFLHTIRPVRGGMLDMLQTPAGLLEWLNSHPERGPAGTGEVQPAEARILLDEARRLRADIRAVVEARHRRREAPSLALHGLNRVLVATRWSWELTNDADGFGLRAIGGGEGPLCRLASVALAASHLLLQVPVDRLRLCAAERCGAWFVDTSKGGRRRWCSMERCGNREKAAVHRAKATRR